MLGDNQELRIDRDGACYSDCRSVRTSLYATLGQPSHSSWQATLDRRKPCEPMMNEEMMHEKWHERVV